MDTANFKCPKCGNTEKVEVPKDVCLPFYKCSHCGELISAPEDSCCVICAYADKKCPVSTKSG
jgi:uncharacterized Zn finger protein